MSFRLNVRSFIVHSYFRYVHGIYNKVSVKVSRVIYISNHLSESIHIYTPGTKYIGGI